MNTKFRTIKQIISYASKSKKAIESLKTKYPELSFLSLHINDIHPDLLYKVLDFVNEGKTDNGTYSFDKKEKIEHRNDTLNLYTWSIKFPMPISFSTCKVKKECDCVERKEFVVAEE